ncbi:asparagine synthase-related protein [Nocardioides sp. Leaf307]|uniref:asparagine synthase-related protein n=1 Tax=Nocardioides sp. Leaf307 TaxID=1736331 RepID=UPI00070383C7|nr:asparagine synthase-related protein [Nocardioides sp. Leaf307]KQQ42939.1 hypothetical protein ASF50_02690 [Nocardioides sp. Leaf307]
MPLSLEPLELAAGIALEPDDGRRCPPPRAHGRSARDVLERLVLDRAVDGRRLAVSFSGGRDSSLILAVACRVARREGLPMPIAVTNRHPSAESREDRWQERVIRHLGVTDWVRIDVADSMDVLGQRSTQLIASGGVSLPPNSYLHLTIAEAVAGGVVLTGVGGDEVLGTPGSRAAAVVTGRVRPRPRDVLPLGLAAAPLRVRRAWKARAGFPFAPWLTPSAEREVSRRLATDDARPRLRWDWEAARWARSRAVALGARALGSVGDLYGCAIVSPLADPAFVDTFAREVGWAGPVSRTGSMELLASDLLPPDVLSRVSKASFGGTVWGPDFRAFVEAWSPDRLRRDLDGLVDAEALHRAWLSPSPPYCSMGLVQQAWLDEDRSPA